MAWLLYIDSNCDNIMTTLHSDLVFISFCVFLSCHCQLSACNTKVCTTLFFLLLLLLVVAVFVVVIFIFVVVDVVVIVAFDFLLFLLLLLLLLGSILPM